ncbi:DEAD/DEAH box helicase [Idiomarina seosinensis]|uniref:DEAD-box ATP-dependent RNA helicase RhpA n=1 Tax=Idiomarina seosinensis TaxID=281739 RepID=A0A432Z4P2_9GAMM|nr:DEAD/DEAH box helicase [Idiomarina seosinensis]RUO72856.1 ATP-dependent RNA helicase [Idiomarina seosinensis]
MSNNSTGMSFTDMALPADLFNQLEKLGFTQPTPIQQQAIPALLEGKDVLGEAQTGTGKTAAFGLPALAAIDPSVKQTQVLVVTPTRELAIQVAEAIEGFAKQMKGVDVATVYGGAAFGPQVQALKKGTSVIVGTPGRLIDLLNKKVLKLDALRVAVLDEADEMLNMGFIEDIETLLSAVPEGAQRALFSATMPAAIRKLAKTFLDKPMNIQIEAIAREKATITQKAWKVAGLTKMAALTRLLEVTPYQRALIFVRTRQDTMDLAELLQRSGFKASPLSGDLNQAQREQTVSQLRSGHIEILVATDVVARGLDVPEITHVINYDLPGDTESYVHRIGRTGRAGREGEAILFYRPKERHLLRHYERLTNSSIEYFDVPNAQQLSEYRQQKLLGQIEQSLQQENHQPVEQLLQKWLSETELSAEQIALALLKQQHKQQPLFLKEDRVVRERPERSERADRGGDRRKPRAERSNRAADVDFDTYKIQVGREHGARPGDIVGAIANEGSMDSRFIGQIQLFDQHSLVQLPKGMPAEVVKVLKRARVRQHPMSLELSTEQVSRSPKPPRGGRDARKPAGRRGQGAARRFN